MGTYNPIYTKTFEKQLRGLNGKYLERVEEKIQDLVNDPWHNTAFLKGQYRGKRKLRLNRTDRLLFVICEECQELRHNGIYNDCDDCDDIPENTIKIAGIIFKHKY